MSVQVSNMQARAERAEAELAAARAHAGILLAALENLGHGQVGDLFCVCAKDGENDPECAASIVDAAIASTPADSSAELAALREVATVARAYVAGQLARPGGAFEDALAKLDAVRGKVSRG